MITHLLIFFASDFGETLHKAIAHRDWPQDLAIGRCEPFFFPSVALREER